MFENGNGFWWGVLEFHIIYGVIIAVLGVVIIFALIIDMAFTGRNNQPELIKNVVLTALASFFFAPIAIVLFILGIYRWVSGK